MAGRTRKSNGLGHTYKVGNSYKTVIRHQGHVITANSKSKQESQRKAKEKMRLLPTSRDGLIREGRKVLLREFLMEWLENEHKNYIAHTTYLRYRSLAIHHINPLLGKYTLQDLTPRLITWFLGQMKDSGQGARSQQQARALLSITLRAAEERELIENNPVRKVRNPQNRDGQINPLSLDEVKRLLKTYEGTYLSARLHIALLCGLRQGEALGLQWSDIDFGRQILYVRRQIQKVYGHSVFTDLKSSRSRRSLVLNEESIKALEKHLSIVSKMQEIQGENWNELNLVFPKVDGLSRSPKTDYDEWQKALKLCGITPKRLHDARHTAATLMYSQGVGIETISRALGHSSSAITSRLYVHSAEEPLRRAADLMGHLLRN